MNTFLPYPSFIESAQALDRARLGKQRVECLQILNALSGKSKGWTNHPATKMWKNHEKWLAKYGLTVCMEWARRGYQDTCYEKIFKFYNPKNEAIVWMNGKPVWLGNEEFHKSHQSNLIRKNPEHYRPIFGFDIPDDLPYIWPTP